MAAESSLQSCEEQGFVDSYYLIDVNDIAATSLFYQQMADTSFKELKGFSAIIGHRSRVSRYFDFDDLEILKTGKELVLNFDDNLPKYRTERESVVYVDNLTSSPDKKTFEVKNYNKSLTAMDKHPLFSRIKRKEREILIGILATISKKTPDTISEKLKVKSTQVVFLVTHYGIAQGAITLSSFNILNFGIPNTSTLLTIELFADKQKELTIDENKYINEIFCQTQEQFRKKLPHIKPALWFGYADYHTLATKALPNRTFFKKYPVLFNIGQIVILSIIGFLIITLFLGRYSKRNNYRTLIITNNKSRYDP